MGDLPQYEAPREKIWICLVCRKTSMNQAYGPNGWGVNCFMNSVLVNKDEIVKPSVAVV